MKILLECHSVHMGLGWLSKGAQLSFRFCSWNETVSDDVSGLGGVTKQALVKEHSINYMKQTEHKLLAFEKFVNSLITLYQHA